MATYMRGSHLAFNASEVILNRYKQHLVELAITRTHPYSTINCHSLPST